MSQSPSQPHCTSSSFISVIPLLLVSPYITLCDRLFLSEQSSRAIQSSIPTFIRQSIRRNLTFSIASFSKISPSQWNAGLFTSARLLVFADSLGLVWKTLLYNHPQRAHSSFGFGASQRPVAEIPDFCLALNSGSRSSGAEAAADEIAITTVEFPSPINSNVLTIRNAHTHNLWSSPAQIIHFSTPLTAYLANSNLQNFVLTARFAQLSLDVFSQYSLSSGQITGNPEFNRSIILEDPELTAGVPTSMDWSKPIPLPIYAWKLRCTKLKQLDNDDTMNQPLNIVLDHKHSIVFQPMEFEFVCHINRNGVPDAFSHMKGIIQFNTILSNDHDNTSTANPSTSITSASPGLSPLPSTLVHCELPVSYFSQSSCWQFHSLPPLPFHAFQSIREECNTQNPSYPLDLSSYIPVFQPVTDSFQAVFLVQTPPFGYMNTNTDTNNNIYHSSLSSISGSYSIPNWSFSPLFPPLTNVIIEFNRHFQSIHGHLLGHSVSIQVKDTFDASFSLNEKSIRSQLITCLLVYFHSKPKLYSGIMTKWLQLQSDTNTNTDTTSCIPIPSSLEDLSLQFPQTSSGFLLSYQLDRHPYDLQLPVSLPASQSTGHRLSISLMIGATVKLYGDRGDSDTAFPSGRPLDTIRIDDQDECPYVSIRCVSNDGDEDEISQYEIEGSSDDPVELIQISQDDWKREEAIVVELILQCQAYRKGPNDQYRQSVKLQEAEKLIQAMGLNISSEVDSDSAGGDQEQWKMLMAFDLDGVLKSINFLDEVTFQRQKRKLGSMGEDGNEDEEEEEVDGE